MKKIVTIKHYILFMVSLPLIGLLILASSGFVIKYLGLSENIVYSAGWLFIFGFFTLCYFSVVVFIFWLSYNGIFRKSTMIKAVPSAQVLTAKGNGAVVYGVFYFLIGILMLSMMFSAISATLCAGNNNFACILVRYAAIPFGIVSVLKKNNITTSDIILGLTLIALIVGVVSIIRSKKK